MATEEQKNNQQTLNDLLNDYKNGQIEAAEYTAVVTSRTADLSDALRQTVKLKKTSSELDKQLLGSVKRISDLARTLESPYTKISDVQKDIVKSQKEQIKLDNTLLALKNKLSANELANAEAYIKSQGQVLKNEKDFEQVRASASAEEKKYADILVTNERALQAEIKKRGDLYESVNRKEFDANKKLLEEKKKAEKDAINEASQLRQNQFSASESLQSATKEVTKLKESGLGPDDIKFKEAEEARLRAQQNYDLSKEATLNKELQIKGITRDITSFAEESFTSKEKELLTSFEIEKNLKKEKKDTDEIIKSNKNINSTLIDQVTQKGVALDKSIDDLATQEKGLSPHAKIYAQGVATSEINKANTEYLGTQEEYLKDIEKRQASYNLTLGFAEGLLKKLGASNATIALGLEEGKKAAEEMAKAIEDGNETSGIFGGQLKILGAGIKGTFKGMADGLKNLSIATILGVGIGKAVGLLLTPVKKAIKGAFDAIMFPAKKIFGEIQGYFSSFTNYISSSFLSIQGFVDTFNKGDQLLQQLSQATEDIATGLGVSTQEAKNLTNQVGQFSEELGAFPEKLAQNMVALNQAFGTTQKFSDETARSFNRMVERLGFSTEEAAEFVKIAKITGETENDILGGIEDQTMALKNQYGVAISQKSIFQDISKASSATRLSLGNNTKELTNAAFQAKRLGLEMNQVASMGSNLLEFESSIANEMEAELLIGRDLNLERARAAFLNNDIATAAKEIAGQIGSAADFSKMNVIQQEALAKAVGTNREGLADMLTTQEMLANTGFDDMNKAQQEFNKHLENGLSIEQAQAKFKQQYGNEALASQVAQVSYAKQREQQERNLIDSASKMADAFMPIIQAARNFQESIEKIREVMINQMRPFFKELGFFIGSAGKEFAIILESYVKPLGKRLNDIGLTLISFARENGPAIKKTFGSILDVFGSIYGLVGDIIKELFNVKGTSSVADPLKNTLQLVQDIAKDVVSYVKSIDAGGIAKAIQSVITGIGSFYQGLYNFVKGTITTIKGAINYFIENPIKSIVGTGAAIGLAKLLKRGSSRLFPMFTKNIDGPGLTGTSRIFNAIKGLSKVTGGKKTVVGRALRNAAAMAGKKGSISSQVMKGAKGALGQLVGKVGSGASGLAGRIGLSSLSGAGATGVGAAGAGATGAGAAGAGATGVGAAGSLGPAILGLVASYGLNVLKKDQQAKVSSIDVDLTKDISTSQVKILEEQKEISENNSKRLGVAAEAAKYAGIGATIGSIFPGVGTALGAGIGTIVGGAIGTYKEYGDDISDWGSALGLWSERASKAADDFNKFFKKTQQELARTQAKIAKNLQKAEVKRNLAIERATRDVVDQFKDLASAGKINFETVKSTDKGFQDFARQMYLAGNLTKEEFQNAINGTITPMNALKSATEGASSRLNQAFSEIESKINEKTKAKTEVARYEFIAEKGFDPEKFKNDAERILTSIQDIDKGEFTEQINESRRNFADVQASELLSVLEGGGTNAGITKTEAEDIKSSFTQLQIAAAKGNKKQIEEINAAFNVALSQFDREYGNLDLEEEESSGKLVELYQTQLGNAFDQVTAEYTQKVASLEAEGTDQLATDLRKERQMSNATTTINQNFAKNQGQIIESLETDNKTTSGLIEDQLKSADELYKLLDIKLTNQGTSLQNILTGGINSNELITLQKGLIELSKAALETDNADLSEKVIELSSNLGVQDGAIRPIQPIQDGTALPSKGPFTIADKFGATAITAAGDGVVVSPNITHVNDAITNPVTGEVKSIIIPELQNLELDLNTLNAAIGLLQELLLKGNIPSYEGTQAQALFVDYKDGTKDLVYNMERKSINIARSIVNTIERMGAAEYLVEIGKQAGEVTETILQSSSPSGSYQNIQYQISKAQTVQDGSSISHNGPFTIQDSRGNLAITHPNDKLVVSPNVSYIADGATGKGGPVFPVSEKFGALDVKVGKEGVLVQKINDGITSSLTNETTINHINTSQQVMDGFTGLTELRQAEKEGLPVEYQPGVNVVGAKGPFTSRDTIEPLQIGSRIIKGLGALAKIYKLSSEQKEERSNLQQEWNENYRIAYNLSKKGLDSQFAVEGVSPYYRTVTKFERLVNSINKTEKEAISKHVPIFFHDMMAKEEGRAAHDTNDYGTAIQLGFTEGQGGAIKYDPQGRPSNASMILNTYVEPSKLYKNYTPPVPEAEVTESIVPKRITSEATERVTVRGTEGNTFVTYENGKVVESSTIQQIQDGLLTQDEIFKSYGITTEAKTKKYTYKQPKTSSSKSKTSSNLPGSPTSKNLEQILKERALTKEEEKFRNQGLLAGTLFKPDMQLLRENKRDTYELKINPADYFDPIKGTSILDKTQYEFGTNAKYGLGHTYTPNVTPTYNSHLTPGYEYGIFDFEDLTTVLSKPVNVNAQGGAIGMSLGMVNSTLTNLQEMSAGGGIDLTQDYNTHPEMQSIMQKVLPSQVTPSSAIDYTAQPDATNINVPNFQFAPYYNDAAIPTIGDEGLQQVNDGIGFWEVISNPMGAVKHYVLPTLIEESGHVIKSLFKTKALSTALKGILKKTPIIGHAMHAGTGALNISHLLHEKGMSEDQLNQEVGTAALVTLGGIGGGIIGGMLAGTLSSITGPGAIVIGTLGGIAGSMIGEIFAEFAADTLGAEPVGRPIVSMFKQEEASLPLYRPHLTENVAPKLESQFEPPQNVLDGYSYLDVMTNPKEYLKNTLSEVGEMGLVKLVNGAFAATAIKKGALNLSKTATKKLPYIGPIIETLVGGYDAYNTVEEYKNDPQSPPISKLYQELGTIGYETLGGMGGSLIGGLALTPVLGPAGSFIGGLLGGLGGQIVGSLLADIFGAESMGKTMTDFFTSVPQQVQDGSALSSRGPFTITDKFGATAITAKGDGVVVSPNISYVNDGMVDAEPINQIATSSTQQYTTVIEQDNSELKQELESMKQLMSNLIKELPTIANRPITIELDGNKVGEGLGRIDYRG